ncbi:MAG: ribosome biogenesis GTPase YlqF [Oscillospiraceae bacterium]|nr:ribosome biogenesis GTPase YlqF [Oscillospiraceae bacterium]
MKNNKNNIDNKNNRNDKHIVNPIQWFPGHMAKTRRIISESLPQVDIVLELLDSRAVISSQNPEIKKLTGKFNKPVLTLMNKSDLADNNINQKWVGHYRKNGEYILPIDCRSGAGLKNMPSKIKEILSEKLERYKSRGMTGRRIKAMIVGIPNVGKSSLLNKICRDVKAKVEDRPGVTLRKQWVSADNFGLGIDLLDMPGVLWPKFESEEVGLNLAFIGSIKDDVLDLTETAVKLCVFLGEKYPEELASRYKLDINYISEENIDGYEIFSQIGKNRGYIISGGEIDGERCAKTILTEFRSAKIGRISLEQPEINN